MKVNVLDSKRVLFGDNLESLAEYLEISRQTLSAKLKGEYAFKDTEIRKITSRYNLTPEEVYDIFISDEEI